MVGGWLRGRKPKRVSRYGPDLAPSSDLAYVAGFYLGDGKDAGEEHKVRFELADRIQLEYVGRLVAGLLGRDPKPLGRDGTFYTVQYDSVILSNFLNQDVDRLVQYLNAFIPDLLCGFFDAEGYVSWSVDVAGLIVKGFIVGAANTNPDYLGRVKILLAGLGIRAAIRATNKAGSRMTIRGRTWIRKHDVFHVVITSVGDIKAFGSRVGFRNSSKATRMKDVVRMTGMTPADRYVWFQARYEKVGRRWLRMEK